MNANDFHCVQNRCRMHNFLAVSFEGCSGLALIWRKRVDVAIQSFSKHHIDSLVRLENHSNIRVIGLYGHSNPNLRSSS